MTELETKLALVRKVLSRHGLAAVRLRGVDWFSWATCGGSSVVILTAETGIAEVLVTPTDAWVLTSSIEVERLKAEEVPKGLPVWSGPWAAPEQREVFVREVCPAGPVASDRPAPDEVLLPVDLAHARWSLLPQEIERYRSVGRDAAAAMTDVLATAKPDWTGFELAGAGAAALWAKGIHPTLTLVGDEARLPIHRHATPSSNRLGGRAMLVCCARRHGLYANLTRFVYFRRPSQDERRINLDVAHVEAAALNASRPGAALSDVFAAIVKAYVERGHACAEASHHQGGPCGYLSRDTIARPASTETLEPFNAVAWNPSLPGAKIEDTAIVKETGVEVVTIDPRWPTMQVGGRARPDLLVR